MPNLQGTVGAGGANSNHEVALVQLMLRVVKNAKGAAYFSANYTGTYDDTTKNAIIAFQKDKGLLPAAAAPGAKPAKPGGAVPVGPPVLPAGAKETEGLIGPATQTYQKLVAGLPADYAKIRAMPGLKTIYVEADDATATASANTTRADAQLNAAFRGQVASLIEAMQATHKIALWVEPVSGRTRGFQKQYEILQKGTSQAGPGESNHNWGFAVDIGFKNFKWVSGDSSFVTDNYWLGSLVKVKSGDSNALWAGRNVIAAGKNLHKTNFAGDLIHLQNFNDANISMRNSLAKQLARVGKFKWDRAGNSYTTDLGTGSKLEAVGNSSQLWTKQSNPSKGLVAGWQNLQEKAAWAKLSQIQKDQLNKTAAAKLPPGTKLPPGFDPGLKIWKEAEVTPALIDGAKAAIRKEMETAEAKRDQWKPAP